MAEIGISYSAKTNPSEIGIRCDLSFSDKTLQGTVRSLDDFTLTVTPTGNMAEEVVSGVAWPLAQYLSVTVIPPLVRALVEGQSFNLITVDRTKQVLGKETITITPKELAVSNFNGMLLVAGDVDIT